MPCPGGDTLSEALPFPAQATGARARRTVTQCAEDAPDFTSKTIRQTRKGPGAAEAQVNEAAGQALLFTQ